MAKTAILLISDIHYSDNKASSMFRIGDDNEYYQKWVNCINKIQSKHDICIKYMVISGDVADNGTKQQYRAIGEFLKKFRDEFNILNDNILLIPGNHDIDRSRLQVYCDDNGISGSDAAEQFNVKLEKFCEFYKDFLGKDLCPDRAILNSIYIDEENAVLLGLNSLAKESFRDEDHKGYIDIGKFRENIKDYANSGKTLVAVSHHSFTMAGGKEPPSIENVDSVREALRQSGVDIFIYGHHHTAQNMITQKDDEEKSLRFIEIGSMGKVLDGSFNNRFSILVCEDEAFKILTYAFMQNEWKELSCNEAISRIPVKVPAEDHSNVEGALPMIGEEWMEAADSETEISIQPGMTDEPRISLYDKPEFLMDYLRAGNYRTGHFHWKHNKKTLGWIDITSFLSNIDILEEIKEAMQYMVEKYAQDIQVAVGYGMEGNIMGSILQGYWLEKHISYFYYPSVHKTHFSFEKEMWTTEVSGDRLLLICDIMPPDDYLEEIIASNVLFEKYAKLYIISLFWNKNLAKSLAINVSGKEVVRISLAEVDVDVCEKDESSCMVCQQALEDIYEL